MNGSLEDFQIPKRRRTYLVTYSQAEKHANGGEHYHLSLNLTGP